MMLSTVATFVTVVFSGQMENTTGLVTIAVAEDPPYTLAHEIRIAPVGPRLAQTQEELEQRHWTATRISVRGETTMDSDDCPALGNVARSYSELPSLAIRPPASRIVEGVEAIPPTLKDGFSTTLKFLSRTDDGSYAEVVLGGGNVYAFWGHNAVSALIPCWGPLAP